MEERRRRMVTPQQGVRGLARSSQGSMWVMFEPAHPAFAGASRHTTTLTSSQASLFLFSKISHKSKACTLKCSCLYFVVQSRFQTSPQITHPCSNVRPANLVQRCLQTVENRVRQSLILFLVMMVTLATHVLIMPSLLEHSVASAGTILKKNMACSTYQHGCNRGRFFFPP